MKKIKYLVLLTFFTLIIFMSVNVVGESHINHSIEHLYEDVYDDVFDDTHLFLEKIGERESSGKYSIVNKYGYMGKYQFSPTTLKGLGIRVSKQQFLTNPQLQDSAMVALLIHNRKLLNTYINEYNGSTFNGNPITESGILATAHLVGPHRTKILLKDGMDSKDGFGTNASEYLISFSGYNLNLE